MPKKSNNSYIIKTLAILCNAIFSLLTENQREKFADKQITSKTVGKEKTLLWMMAARPRRMPRRCHEVRVAPSMFLKGSRSISYGSNHITVPVQLQ